MAQGLSSLPPELLLNIMVRLNIADCQAFICAFYRLLHLRRIVPAVPWSQLSAMEYSVRYRRRPQWGIRWVKNGQELPLLPLELWIAMGNYLTIDEKINFAIATWPMFQWQ